MIKLISKPLEVNLYLLVYAIVTDNLDEIAENCHYVVENRDGIRYEVYARSDDVFYGRLCSGDLNCHLRSNFSNFFNG